MNNEGCRHTKAGTTFQTVSDGRYVLECSTFSAHSPGIEQRRTVTLGCEEWSSSEHAVLARELPDIKNDAVWLCVRHKLASCVSEDPPPFTHTSPGSRRMPYLPLKFRRRCASYFPQGSDSNKHFKSREPLGNGSAYKGQANLPAPHRTSDVDLSYMLIAQCNTALAYIHALSDEVLPKSPHVLIQGIHRQKGGHHQQGSPDGGRKFQPQVV